MHKFSNFLTKHNITKIFSVLESLVVLSCDLLSSICNNCLQSSRNTGHHSSQHRKILGHLVPFLTDDLLQLQSGLRPSSLHSKFQNSPDLTIKSMNVQKLNQNTCWMGQMSAILGDNFYGSNLSITEVAFMALSVLWMTASSSWNRGPFSKWPSSSYTAGTTLFVMTQA